MAKINQLAKGANYTLIKGLPYTYNNKGWTNYDRIVAASRVMNGESFQVVASELGCCVRSIKNWINTLNQNNPRLEG